MHTLQSLKYGMDRTNKLVAVISLVFISGTPGVHAELPVAHTSIPWSNNVQILRQTGTELHIGQNENLPGNWLLNWQSFNVSADSRVQFHQPNSSHIALNRIFQNDASRIMGSIDANGRVYLINSNGFIFGENSKINVNSLVASSLALNLSDDEFINGDKNIANIVNDNQAAFVGGPGMGNISIKDGAEITTQDGGNILMFAPNIFNAGDLTTTSGQTILAASEDKVYLTPSTDPALRGFLVEVKTGGSVENLGNILSKKGNITLAGMAINQRGSLKATTAVNENGSIRLLARDGAGGANFNDDIPVVTSTVNANGVTDTLVLGIDIDKAKDSEGNFLRNDAYFVASRTGEVTLHSGSETSIDIDSTDTALVTDSQTIETPRIEITGKLITLKEGAEIKAPGADVVLHATTNPLSTALNSEGNLNPNDGQSKVVLEAGSRIDVSGTTDTQANMNRNELSVALTANFLRDAPLQRTGPLREGEIKTVTLDIRQGTPLGDIADLVDASIKRGINERLSEGGSVSVQSQGGVLLEQGSEINITGGSVFYNEGTVTSSQLTTLTGQRVDISEANPDVVYTDNFGEVKVKSKRWGQDATRTWRLFNGGISGVSRFHQSYTDASDAGSLTIQTHAAILDQTIIAGTDNGRLQREVADRANGGSYNITLSNPTLSAANNTAQSASIVESRALTQSEINNGSESVLDEFLASGNSIPNWILQITDDSLSNSGLSDFNIKTNGDIRVAADARLNLTDAGSLKVQAKNIQLEGDIKIASGNISLSSFGDLQIDHTLDVSGDWVNDNQNVVNRDLRRAVNLNGGSITLETDNGNLLLGNSSLLVNGGAWLQSEGSIKSGSGGNISLGVNDINGQTAELELGDMQAFAVGRGGELNVTANIIDIANDFTLPAIAGRVELTPEFFQSNGFSDYSIISNTDNLNIHDGVVITPQTRSLVLATSLILDSGFNFNSQPSNNSILNITELQVLEDYARPVTNITLGTNRSGANSFGEGLRLSELASIRAEPDADISLFATRNLFINGEISTQGGDISLALNANYNSLSEYQSDSAIWLGENSQLSTQGFLLNDIRNDFGLVTGKVFNSGNVSIVADRGYIVAEQGSQIDVSGTQVSYDLPSTLLGNSVIGYDREKVNVGAGNIQITAAEGIYLGGELTGRASEVAGASGGELSIALDAARRNAPGLDSTLTLNGRELHVLQNIENIPDNFLTGMQGSAVNNDHIGHAFVSSETVSNGGFDNLILRVENISGTSIPASTGSVVFEDNVDLQLAQSLQILSPIIRAEGTGNSQINLSAPYILLGSLTGQQPLNGVVASTGNGGFNVQAGLQGNDGLLELVGGLRLQGINTSTLHSEGDIRLRGVQESRTSTSLTGSFETQGNLNLNSDQIYATTLSQFNVGITDMSNGVLSINGGESTSILSAGSELTLSAPVIRQSGVIKAPIGQINLNASQQLILDDGSITSVSAEGLLIPFGSTLGEERWVYPLDPASSIPVFVDITTPPAKEINYQSPDVQIAATAITDISGGGDLYSWEFVPGLGGSVDNLLPENSNGSFAVLPGTTSFGPYDHQYWLNETGREVGQQVFLQGNNDLTAGLYTILPARYALLPGAFLITPTNNTVLPSQVLNRLDGATIVAGQQRIAGTDRHDELWSGYVVETGEDVRLRSQYIESQASQFFRDDAVNNDIFLSSMPSDAGTLNILAGNNLDLSGILRGDAAAFNYFSDGENFIGTGRGSQVNIAANNLRVVNEFDINGGNQLLASNLNALNADSLMLGGTRQRRASGVDINVITNNLELENNVNLNQSELYLVANETIDVRSGVNIISHANAQNTDTQINVSGDGALVRASANSQIRINRQNESTNPVDGVVNIESGAVLDVSQSLAIDSSVNTIIDGELKLNGGSLNLGAAKISIGDNSGVVSGLQFTTNDLIKMNAGELLLTSRSSIDLYGELDLQLNNLLIDAANINGYQSQNQQARISANNISLGNASNSVSNDVATGSGNLILNAQDIELNKGNFNLNGFNDVSLIATDNIKLSGQGALNTAINGDLLLNSAVVTASSGADYGVFAGLSNLLIQNNGASDNHSAESLGAKVEFQASNITHQGIIDITSGYLSLNATNDLLLDNASSINLSGIERDFAGESIYTPGGVVNLNSVNSNITMLSSASVDVSAGSGKGDAGTINVSATTDNVNLNGQLFAAHGTEKRAGSVSIDALVLSDLAGLNNKLNTSGFNQNRFIRLRQSDLNISVNDSIVASTVFLQADAGDINIQGTIDSQGNEGGTVDLAAANDVNLAFTSSINANAVNGNGGHVNLSSRDGIIDISAGNLIDVSGSAEKDNGSLYLRVSRDASGDAKINALAGDLQGVDRIDIESYKVYDFNNLTTALSENMNVFSDIALTTLGLNDTTNVHQRKGIEIRSQSDINFNSALDLFSNRNSSEAGILTLRSAGDVNINNNITDGFSGGRLQQGESWSYNMIAGADFNAASIQSVTQGAGNFKIDANRSVHTGSGNIFIAAGNDITLEQGASIYTAGQSTGRGSYENVAGFGNALDGFLLPNVEFPDQGGDVSIQAGGNITSSPSSLLVSDWLYRLGDKYNLNGNFDNIGTTWGIEFTKFKHGVGALGGGNVSISASGNIVGLSAFTPTTGKQLGELSIDPNTFTASITGNIVEQHGQGDINVVAGGDIKQSLLFSANGNINVLANGSIGDEVINNGLSIISANTQSNVFAGGDIHFLGANNFSLLPISKNQEAANFGVFPLDNYRSFYSTYSEDAAIRLISLNGDIDIINPQASALSGIYKNGIEVRAGNETNRILANYPGTFQALSINGDIDIQNNFVLWPSSQGDFSLAAQNDITGSNDLTGLFISMLDIAPQDLPSIQNTSSLFDLTVFPDRVTSHAENPVNAGNQNPVRIIANTGSIFSTDIQQTFLFETNKQTEVYAGRDIANVSFNIQNNNSSDISFIQAGRDIEYINSAEFGRQQLKHGVIVSGPGQLQVLAGRNINLGDQKGIVSNGNNTSPALLNESSSLLVMAGLGDKDADYSAFIDQYFTQASEYTNDLILFMENRGETNVSFSTALNRFKQLDIKAQRSFIVRAFANEYTQSGMRAAQEQSGRTTDNKIYGYSRGIEAIATLFPGTVVDKRVALEGEKTEGDLIVTGGFAYTVSDVNPAYAGNLSMVSSAIQAQDNKGDITVLTPGGLVNVGLSVSTGNSNVEKGIITKGDGFINVFSHANVAVNQSRIQALNGGDISIWSTKGDIDAGKGAKSALTIPPPRIIVDQQTGTVTQVFDAVVQGNGIQNACFDAGCVDGSAILSAPAGIIDAGDAGIRSSGNIFIAAEGGVVNGNQIEAGGDVSGAVGGSSALGADIGGLDVNSSGDSAATELVAEDASALYGAGSIAILQVEVMGLSGEPETGAAPVIDESSTNKTNNEKDAGINKKKDNLKDQARAGEKQRLSLMPDISMLH